MKNQRKEKRERMVWNYRRIIRWWAMCSALPDF